MRFAVRLVLLLLGLAGTAGSARADDTAANRLATLLATVRKSGAVTREPHLARTATETIGGLTYRVLDDTAGAREWERRCEQDVCQGTYFDGSRTFDVGINGTALPRTLHPDSITITMRAIETGAFAADSFRAGGGSVALLGSVAASDALPASCVHQFSSELTNLAVSAPNGVSLHALVDPHHGFVAAIRSSDDTTTLAFCDYRRVDRYRVPFQSWTDGRLVREQQSIDVSSAPLAPPHGIDVKFEGAPDALAMETVRTGSNQPVVPCSLEGVNVACLIDSGNSGLGISLDLVERLDLSVGGEFAIEGFGQYLTGITQAGPLRVGNVTFGNSRFIVLHDLHQLGYDIVLGADAFAATRLTLDYPRQTVTFAPRASAAAAEIPIRFVSFLPVVGAQFGNVDAALAIDTGDESSVDLAQSYYVTHPALFEPSSSRSVIGIGGSGQQVLGTIPDVRIANYDVTAQPIGVTPAAGTVADGRLGSGFLSHFVVTFDYANGRMGLDPHPGDKAVKTSGE